MSDERQRRREILRNGLDPDARVCADGDEQAAHVVNLMLGLEPYELLERALKHEGAAVRAFERGESEFELEAEVAGAYAEALRSRIANLERQVKQLREVVGV